MHTTKQTDGRSVKQDYKSRMFTMIFKDKTELLQLYNAVGQRNYDDSELLVDVLNINVGHNKELLQACKTLGDYSEYVYRVREYAKEMSIEEAVDRSIGECIKEGILKEFLERNRAEARAMSIYEYDQEEHIRLEREDAYEDGRRAQLIVILLEILSDFGTISEELKNRVMSERDLESLTKWVKTAVKANSLEEFINKM